jgi:cyclic pyranopterin phosphate synthase
MNNKELRLLLTSDCNFDCRFCHKEGLHKKSEIKMTLDDYIYLYKVCKDNFGWTSITLTGGEPLMYPELTDLVDGISQQKGIITLVSNGVFLDKHLDSVYLIDRVNVSLHSMDAEKYNYLTRKGNLLKVQKNIGKVRAYCPHVDVRLNVVLTKDFNDSPEDLKLILDFAESEGCSVKFIELANDADNIVTIDEIQSILQSFGFMQRATTNRKRVLDNNRTDVYLTQTPCETAQRTIKPGESCNVNMNFCITPSGMVNHCDVTNEEASILDEINNRDDKCLIARLSKIGEDFGKNCVFNG